ncbi:MAG: hypothetical protein LBS24_03505 [Clostridiales Family XIII bacterium]|jgi:hypothetical protein|nr:hypothetical protein [Clostridiales Family XIII bacterium]
MRKPIGLFFTVLLTLFLSTAPSFAAGLNLVDNYPEEGSRSSPPINLGIKLFFDRDVSAKELRAQNEACFKLSDEEGKSVPLKVLYTETDPTYILVIAEPEDEKVGLGSDKEYKFEIAPEFQTIDGSALETQKIITFRTRNTDMDMKVNMVLMGVMFVGMLVFSTISMRRQMKKTASADDKQRVNPYKIAKETGKSVTEVVAQEEKKKQRSAKKNASANAALAGKDGAAEKSESATDSLRRVKRVKGPRPIAAAGSDYRTGRKAAAEKKAREEAERRARGTTKPKGQGAKNKKKKQ